MNLFAFRTTTHPTTPAGIGRSNVMPRGRPGYRCRAHEGLEPASSQRFRDRRGTVTVSSFLRQPR